jgi:hypothetical protein
LAAVLFRPYSRKYSNLDPLLIFNYDAAISAIEQPGHHGGGVRAAPIMLSVNLNKGAAPTAQGARAWSQATVHGAGAGRAFIDYAIAVGQGVLVGFI